MFSIQYSKVSRNIKHLIGNYETKFQKCPPDWSPVKFVQILVMISPISIKSKYLKCLEAKYLNFYPSRKALIKASEGAAVPFEIRYCPTLVAKKTEISATATCPTIDSSKLSRNPFLPFDQNLLVSDLDSSVYALIFNKFCLIPEHLLVITRDFVEQAAELTSTDFQIVMKVMESLEEISPLAFYNSGPEAGASQVHRHFQVIPTENIPIEEHIKSVLCFNEPFKIPLYSSFVHGCIRRPADSIDTDWQSEAYVKLKVFCNKYNKSAFNLLWTRDWILLVPRKREFTHDNLNSLNAMAFAGYFLVMDEDRLDRLNVLECLEQVTYSPSQ